MTALASLSGTRSFQLNVHVTNLQTQKSIAVNQDSHVGVIMLEIVEKLDVTADYSDHALWWPEKKIWLEKARLSLLSYGITYDTQVLFTPQHKCVRLQMPDLQYIDMRVNFATDVFHTVQELCGELGIRHPEELSLMKPYESAGSKKRQKTKKDRVPGGSGSDETGSQGSMGNGTLGKEPSTPNQVRSPAAATLSTPGSPGRGVYNFSESDTLNPYATALSPMLTHSPATVTAEQLDNIGRGKSLVERAKFNTQWLASAESLMQQDVKEYDSLLLRFKYYNFFDINPKIDEVRINQIFEQAKWQVLTEEMECTEEEAIKFAALQFQVKVAAANPQTPAQAAEVDDIESALNELQMTLEGTTPTANEHAQAMRSNLSHIPEMKDNLNLIRQKKLGLKSVKTHFFVFKDTHIAYFKQQSESLGHPIQKVNLKGCEVTPDVNIGKEKYNIKLRIPGADMTELDIGCNSSEQYVKWMAACRLASKGKTMADPSYDVEISGVRTFLSLQSDGNSNDNDASMGEGGMTPEDFVSPKILNKYKNKQLAARILEAHSSFSKLGLLEAKLNYIRQWQSLPEFGITKFNAKFRDSKKKAELVGVGTNKVTRIEVNSRQVMKSWRYLVMKNWNVNWETKEMIISCEGDDVAFSLVDGDVRLVHEFIGGYIFLSMRKDVNAPLDDEMFYKLTGGWNTIGGGEGKDWSSKYALS